MLSTRLQLRLRLRFRVKIPELQTSISEEESEKFKICFKARKLSGNLFQSAHFKYSNVFVLFACVILCVSVKDVFYVFSHSYLQTFESVLTENVANFS